MIAEATTANPTAQHWDCPAEVYHADRECISRSMLEDFIEDPALFEGKYITREFPPEKGAALDFGTVVHDIVLGPPFTIDRDNYAHRTIACWRACKPPDGTPDYESTSGSAYYYSNEGVIRVSDHWGEVGGCYWALRGKIPAPPWAGYCRWTDFIFNESFRPIPPDVLASNGARNGGAWKQFAAENHPAILLKEQEFEPISYMLAALREHPKARAILECEGHSEYTIRWRDQETGLTLRSRLDRITPLFIADLKTAHTTNPGQFERHCYQMGYHRQAAFYQDAAQALLGEFRTFVFIAMQKSPPYSVETFVPSSKLVAIGRRENREALRQLAECKASGRWRRDGYGRLVEINAPKWVS